MDRITIQQIIIKAVETLFINQPNIFEFTSETRQTEWNLAHHLANEIYKAFPKLSCDLDVAKINYENKRPDIIFHVRGTQKNNFLIIEMKRDGSSADMKDDVEKIESYWLKEPLRYQFGAAININSDKTYSVEVSER